MSINELSTTINAMTVSGKGLLAADESTPTMTKRFNALGIDCTEEARKTYRELLFTAPNIEKYISGVILFEETLFQHISQDLSFADLLSQKGIIPGIKVDKGLIHLRGLENENSTQGLDGLTERLITYKKHGARFAKWRSVFSISTNTPSLLTIKANAEDLARYAYICQQNGLVPIVEPEVLIDGDHGLDRCIQVSEQILQTVFQALYQHHVLLEYMILKPSMVTPSKNNIQQANAQDMAKATLSTLYRTVPAAVPSINFLSGGQTPEQATQNLEAINIANKNNKKSSWHLSFSFARALQEPCMKAWLGKPENRVIAQEAFINRAKLNSLASGR